MQRVYNVDKYCILNISIHRFGPVNNYPKLQEPILPKLRSYTQVFTVIPNIALLVNSQLRLLHF